MKTTLKLLVLFLFIGCKNPNLRSDEAREKRLSEVSKANRKAMFASIASKKESPESFTNIRQKFDLTRRFTNREIIALNLDTTKIESNEYYLLTDEKFLKKDLKTISFLIFYRHKYGDQLEKILRIKNKNAVSDLTLAMTGGDGQDGYNLSTEFVNDSIFKKTVTHKQTAKDNTHMMAYSTDSIITTFIYDDQLNFTEIKKDSLNVYKEIPIYHKEVEGKPFKTWSSPFTINNLQCRWEYEVEYTNKTTQNPDRNQLLVNLKSQKLIHLATRNTILQVNMDEYYAGPKNITQLENHEFPQYPHDIIDINADGYNDIQVITEIAGAGANTSYATFLYNPSSKSFSYSEIFSGYNIRYDAEKSRILSFSKNGVGNYQIQTIHLKPNKKDVDFIENERHYGNTIVYEKVVNGKIIEKRKSTK